MKQLLRAYVFGLVSIMLAATGAAAQETGFGYLERELFYIMKIWPGEYDNQEQVSYDTNAALGDAISTPRVHSLVARIEAPDFGDHVVFVQEQYFADGEPAYRQWLYRLQADDVAKSVRAVPYIVTGPLIDRSSIGSIDTASVSIINGCDLLLRRDAEALTGAHATDTCTDKMLAGKRMHISKDMFGVMPADSTATLRQMERARWFACMIDVPKDIPGRSNHTQHYMTIHDQGGQYEFTHPDGREMTLLMRNTWSYGMHRETFFIGVFEGGVAGKLLVYSWGEPGADRIGMNPGYIRIQCDLDTPENVALQHGLRAES